MLHLIYTTINLQKVQSRTLVAVTIKKEKNNMKKFLIRLLIVVGLILSSLITYLVLKSDMPVVWKWFILNN